MTRTFAHTARDYEQALREEFEIEGCEIVDQNGVLYARIATVSEDEAGSILLTDVNISRMAVSLERRLS